ncbi:hypothetical protein Tco_1047108, partial [Tanacetum coccineum]
FFVLEFGFLGTELEWLAPVHVHRRDKRRAMTPAYERGGTYNASVDSVLGRIKAEAEKDEQMAGK